MAFEDFFAHNTPVLLDGATGSELIARGLKGSDCAEQWNVDEPEKIKDIAAAHFEAGSDAVYTNTFGGSTLKLREWGLEERAYELNLAGCKNAIEVKPEGKFVIGSIGPSGKFMAPVGSVTEEEMIGSDIRWYFPDKKSFRHFVQQYARQLALRDLENIEYMLRSKEGFTIPCSLSGRAIDTNDLTQGVVWVVEDIRDRKKAEKELYNAHELLKELNLELEKKVEERTHQVETLLRQKDEFVNQLGHDLKNPLGPFVTLFPC